MMTTDDERMNYDIWENNADEKVWIKIRKRKQKYF